MGYRSDSIAISRDMGPLSARFTSNIVWPLMASPLQRRKTRTPPPPTEIVWRTFLGSKRNFPGRWQIPKPYIKTRKAISTTKIVPLWPPFFSAKTAKEKFLTGAGRCMLAFSHHCPSLRPLTKTEQTIAENFKWHFRIPTPTPALGSSLQHSHFQSLFSFSRFYSSMFTMRIGCTPRSSYNNTLCRRVLRRFFKVEADASQKVPVNFFCTDKVLGMLLRRERCHRRRLEGA